MANLFLETLLYDVFKAQGAADPAGMAHKVALDFEMDQRNAKIYELRRVMSAKALADRFKLTEQHIHRIIREQMMLKRACA
jgi:hypothetical protein